MPPKQGNQQPKRKRDVKEAPKLTRVTDHWPSLQKWGDVSSYEKELEECGFLDLLLKHTEIPKHNLPLVEALCTFYDSKTFSFKFNNKVKVHYGLLDVLFITGLNIDGDAVTGLEDDEKASEMFKEFISIPENAEKASNMYDTSDGSILLSAIRGLDKNQLSKDELIRLFCFYSIGTVISPNGSHNVPKMYIPLLKDVKKIKDIAWGAGMLAAFHYTFQRSTSGISRLYGPLLPFIVFLCEMIPSFAEVMGAGEGFSPTEFPLMKQWTKELYRASLNTRVVKQKEYYVNFFRRLKCDDVKLHNYENRGLTNIPERVRRQIPVGAAIVPVLNFNIEGRNFPNINHDRFHISKQEANVFVKSIRSVSVKHQRQRRGEKPQGRRWDEFFREAKEQWDDRTHNIMSKITTSCSPGNNVDDGSLINSSRLALDSTMDERSVAAMDSTTNKSQVRKLLVLDIGILADVFSRFDKIEIERNKGRYKERLFSLPLNESLKLNGTNLYAVKRPYCDDFISFCLERFKLAVWSSKMTNNVQCLVNMLFGNLHDRLEFVWDQTDCDELLKKEKVDGCLKRHIFYTKSLEKVWNNFNMYNSENTLLIDGSPEKTFMNPACNVLCPPTYYHNNKVEDKSLAPEGEFQVYLDGLAKAESVSEFRKNTTFCSIP